MTVKLLTTQADLTATGSVKLRTGRSANEGSDVRFYLNVSSLTGTVPVADFTIRKTVDSAEHTFVSEPATIPQVAAGGGTRTWVIPDCPDEIELHWVVGGTVTDLDFTLSSERT